MVFDAGILRGASPAASLARGEGSALSTEVLGDTAHAWFSSPLVAVIVGLACGTTIAMLNRWGAGFMTPEDTTGAGIGMALGVYTLGLLVAAGLMFGYRAIAPQGLPAFGISLVSSILVVTVLALVPAMRELRTGSKGR